MSTVFITGCASGFGHHLTRRLLAAGHRVVATDPAPAGWQAELGTSPRLLTLPIDVRDAASVRAAVDAALAWSPVDVLVNNAGYAVFGSQEELDLDRAREMFEVNVFGAARVTQALLPSIRDRRGTIVQLSSVAGRTVFTESGFYAASKYALEAMSEALFQETCTFGVRVRVIEPGSFNTRFLERAAAESPPPSPESPYAHLRPAWDVRKRAVLEPPQDPALVVDAIVASLDRPEPFLRVPVGPDSERILAVRDALGPDGWSRLAADRAGLVADHRPGEVLYPEEVVAAALRGDRDALGPSHVAWRLGHLDHWAETDVGLEALAALAAL